MNTLRIKKVPSTLKPHLGSTHRPYSLIRSTSRSTASSLGNIELHRRVLHIQVDLVRRAAHITEIRIRHPGRGHSHIPSRQSHPFQMFRGFPDAGRRLLDIVQGTPAGRAGNVIRPRQPRSRSLQNIESQERSQTGVRLALNQHGVSNPVAQQGADIAGSRQRHVFPETEPGTSVSFSRIRCLSSIRAARRRNGYTGSIASPFFTVTIDGSASSFNGSRSASHRGSTSMASSCPRDNSGIMSPIASRSVCRA